MEIFFSSQEKKNIYDGENKWSCITLDVSAHNFALLVLPLTHTNKHEFWQSFEVIHK